MAKDLNAKQRAFVEAFTGNATEAAIAAGYSKKTAHSIGQRLLKNVEIVAAIRSREEKAIRPTIANREKRQEFWSSTMLDVDEDMKNRLKASELLGKSEGDFLERVEHSGSVAVQVIRFSDLAEDES